MRIATLGISHESNTYSPVPASLDKWLAAGPVEGDDIVKNFATSKATLGGYLEAGDADPDVEVVPLIFYRLTPMNAITEEAFETMVGRLLDGLREQGPWDAVLVANHGAAVSVAYPDADGEILRRIRELVGPDVPIGVTLDMHANISPAMVEHATIINTYQTNPHLDPRPRARKAADLIIRTVRGEIEPVKALEMPPLAINILRQGTSDSPMKELLEFAAEQAKRPGVLDLSVVEGFPYADVEEMGMAFIAITDGDEELASDVAKKIASAAWDMREEMIGDGTDIDEALLHAAKAENHPVVLLDVGDNVGGGSTADSTHVLAAAQRLGIRDLFQSLYDPEAVEACAAAGVGATVELEVGGKTDDLHGSPVSIRGVVRVLDAGTFEDPGATHGGFRFFNVGLRAVVETDDGHTLMLTSRPTGNPSLQQLISVGINPHTQPIIIAKGVHSPRGAFEPIAAEMIWLNTPGCTTADLSTLEYHHRRRPMFPFEPEATYDPNNDGSNT